MLTFNYQNEVVSSPMTIVSGRSSTKKGLILVTNNNNLVFPPQVFEINNHHFKALVHVSPDAPNNFEVLVHEGAYLNGAGGAERLGKVVDKGTFTLHYYPLPQNKPVHLCVVVGRDSNGVYDMPRYKLRLGEVANLDTAILRLKVAGRMMQAFTQDDFHSLGLSNRTFQFVEESTNSQRLFGYDSNSKIPHQEVKIHVLRSPKSVAELRDPDLAQQNPGAKNNGGLFSHAIDLVTQSDFYAPYRERNTAIQCAVMYLDSTWNGSFISAHAALGGGTGAVKMAIFGSHGLHSYPVTFPQVTPCLLDDTRLSTDEVANDANQCSTSWECMCICMGAFIHEIGHSLGSPHQINGVMLRDYIWWNRSFVTRESACVRDNSSGLVVDDRGNFPSVCHWNICDIIRYFYHDSFTIPTDSNDLSFGKNSSTKWNPGSSVSIPSAYPLLPGNVSIKSESGIFMIELVAEDLARYQTIFYPKCYGGVGPQTEVHLNFDECFQNIKNSWGGATDNFHVRILSFAGDLYLSNFKETCFPSEQSIIRSDFGLGRGLIDGYKSEQLGSLNGDLKFIGFDIALVSKIRIFHGNALDGLTVYFSVQGSSREVTLGNVRPHYTDFDLAPGEKLTKFSFRNGAWIDAIEIFTSANRSSGMLGNVNGGHLSVLELPSPNHEIIGFYGYVGDWIDGIGIIYYQK